MLRFLLYSIAAIFISSIFTIRLVSQSFQLLIPESHYAVVKHETTTEELKFHHRIKYVGSSQGWVLSKVDVLSIKPGHSYQYCDLALCYPPQTTNFKSDFSFPMSPGQETDDDNFNYVSLHPDSIDGTTSLKFSFFMEDNQLDFVEYQVDFIIGASSADVVVNNPKNEIKSFPNPASNYTFFDLNSVENLSDAELILFNSIGNRVDEILPEQLSRQVLYNCAKLSPGLYFYRLSSNGLSRGTGTLVITR